MPHKSLKRKGKFIKKVANVNLIILYFYSAIQSTDITGNFVSLDLIAENLNWHCKKYLYFTEFSFSNKQNYAHFLTDTANNCILMYLVVENLNKIITFFNK